VSEVKTDKLSPRTSSGTVTLGTSGDTFSIPSGVTLSNSGTASGFGKVLQVVQGTYDTMVTTTSTTYVSSGLQASITPSSTSNKILVITHVAGFRGIPSGGGNPSGGGIALYRGGASIIDKGSLNYSEAYGLITDAIINYIDSPNSTSSLNYEIYFKNISGGSQRCQDAGYLSSIILMEIAA
jgi:hypothetical protein